MSILQAIVLAIVEGLTEFLPVSSTGHMILATAIMGMESTSFVKLFTICIQLGAILSVVIIYWKRFFQSMDFYYKLLVAFIPSVFFGLLFKKHIDALLENVLAVGISLFVGGIILIFIDEWIKPNKANKEPSYLESLKIGFFQVLAMIPGVSRSGATIIGGMTQGLTRAKAAEFSFFLAVPTMFAATAKDLLDYIKDGYILNSSDIQLLLIGNIIAFIVGFLAIKSFIAFLNSKGFKLFGYYRIIVGSIIILCYFMGYKMNLV